MILPLLDSSLIEVCVEVAAGSLRPDLMRWAGGRTFGVVLAAGGYPETPRLGEPIDGLGALPDGVTAFHAGTRHDDAHRLITAGGRVLTVVGSDRAAVYVAAEAIRFTGKQFRRDIGRDHANRFGRAGRTPEGRFDTDTEAQGAAATVAASGSTA